MHSIDQDSLLNLDKWIQKEFNPNHVSRKSSLKSWNDSLGALARSTCKRSISSFWPARIFLLFFTWTRATFENLAAHGFPVDCDFVLVVL
jgi:hypothetical protein